MKTKNLWIVAIIAIVMVLLNFIVLEGGHSYVGSYLSVAMLWFGIYEVHKPNAKNKILLLLSLIAVMGIVFIGILSYEEESLMMPMNFMLAHSVSLGAIGAIGSYYVTRESN